MMTSLATLLAPRELGARLVASQMRAARHLALAGACLVPVTGAIGWFVGTPQVLPLAVAILFAALGLWARRDIARNADAVLPLAVIGQCIAFTAAFAGSPWQLDSHMLFFAALAVLAALLNVRALLVATVAVAAHHLALGLLVPALVFPSTDLVENLGRALFHAAILLTELGGLILLVQSVTSLDATNTQTIRRQEALQRSTDAAMADQQRAVEVLGRLLGEIARRNLRVRLSDLPSGFAGLQSDFNTAIEAVDQTLGQINHGTMDLRSRIAGIDAGTARLSERSQAQAAGLEKTGAALAQLNASFGAVVDKAEKAAKAIEAVAQRASDGRGVVAQAVSAMSRIESSSARISRMNDMIEDIAFQTNLLALNAGVEAARAGEAGRGFAVVAAEVRGLSLRATETASEIDQMVRESGEEVAVGAQLVGHAGDVLSTIADAVVQMTQGLREIVSTAQDQSRFVSEIGTSMRELDQITRQNAELFFQTATACAELTERIGAMSNRIASFDLDTSREAPEPMRRAG